MTKQKELNVNNFFPEKDYGPRKPPIAEVEKQFHKQVKKACHYEIRRYKGHLQRIIPHDTHKELYQDCWVNITRYYKSFDPDKSELPTWIVNIAKSIAKNYIRGNDTHKRNGEVTSFDEMTPGEFGGTETHEYSLGVDFKDPELKQFLRHCIRKLKKRKHRFIVRETFYRNKSSKIIATDFAVSQRLIVKIRNDAIRLLKVIVKKELRKQQKKGKPTTIDMALF